MTGRNVTRLLRSDPLADLFGPPRPADANLGGGERLPSDDASNVDVPIDGREPNSGGSRSSVPIEADRQVTKRSSTKRSRAAGDDRGRAARSTTPWRERIDDPTEPLYTIAVAADLLGVDTQTLRRRGRRDRSGRSPLVRQPTAVLP